MSRVRQRRRCHAHRTNGQPCKAWAITGAAVCVSHGGATRQVRRAAELRILESSMHRQMADAQERLGRERTDWWVDRIVYASEVLNEDPKVLIDEVRKRGWIIDMTIGEHRWPVGLRTEDEPQLRWDRRFGPRLRG